MTPDEAIAHAQSETARADRERARRIAAEERLASLRADLVRLGLMDRDEIVIPIGVSDDEFARVIAAWREHVNDVKVDMMRIAVGAAVDHFFDGVRAAMVSDLDHAIALRAIKARDHGRAVAAICELLAAFGRELERAPRFTVGADWSSDPDRIVALRLAMLRAPIIAGPTPAPSVETCSGCARWHARNRELEERIAKVREVVR